MVGLIPLRLGQKSDVGISTYPANRSFPSTATDCKSFRGIGASVSRLQNSGTARAYTSLLSPRTGLESLRWNKVHTLRVSRSKDEPRSIGHDSGSRSSPVFTKFMIGTRGSSPKRMSLISCALLTWPGCLCRQSPQVDPRPSSRTIFFDRIEKVLFAPGANCGFDCPGKPIEGATVFAVV